jgi:hypothetical protein
VDQLVKYNPQIEPENDWDEIEISSEKSGTPEEEQLSEISNRYGNTSGTSSNDSAEKNDKQNSVTDNSSANNTGSAERLYPLRDNRGRIDH